MTVLNSQEFAIFKTPRFFEFGQLFIANVHDFLIILQNTFLNSMLKKMDFSLLDENEKLNLKINNNDTGNSNLLGSTYIWHSSSEA